MTVGVPDSFTRILCLFVTEVDVTPCGGSGQSVPGVLTFPDLSSTTSGLFPHSGTRSRPTLPEDPSTQKSLPTRTVLIPSLKTSSLVCRLQTSTLTLTCPSWSVRVLVAEERDPVPARPHPYLSAMETSPVEDRDGLSDTLIPPQVVSWGSPPTDGPRSTPSSRPVGRTKDRVGGHYPVFGVSLLSLRQTYRLFTYFPQEELVWVSLTGFGPEVSVWSTEPHLH